MNSGKPNWRKEEDPQLMYSFQEWGTIKSDDDLVWKFILTSYETQIVFLGVNFMQIEEKKEKVHYIFTYQ
jgi:hypothetical protein